jgi:hypothetical protein
LDVVDVGLIGIVALTKMSESRRRVLVSLKV